jgi:hypothetical protein
MRRDKSIASRRTIAMDATLRRSIDACNRPVAFGVAVRSHRRPAGENLERCGKMSNGRFIDEIKSLTSSA